MGKMKKLNNNGSALVVLLSILVVVAIGGVGYMVYSNQNKSNESATTNETGVKDKEEAAQPLSEASQITDGYLEIAEFGVKLKLTEETKDAYYVVKGDNKDWVGISTKEISKIYPGCSAEDDMTMARILTFKDPNQPDPFAGESTMGEAFPDALKVNDIYYAFLSFNQAPCDDKLVYADENSYEYKKFKSVDDSFDNSKLEKL
jgi:hypothetical protein